MIDTVELKIYTVLKYKDFIKNNDLRVYRSNGVKSYQISKKNLNVYYREISDRDRIGGWLTIRFSVTKFLYGNNRESFREKDNKKLIKNINRILREVIKIKLISVAEWNVTRLDLVANYICVNKKELDVYLDIIKKIEIPYIKKEKTIAYKTSLAAQNNGVRYNFYNKFAKDKNGFKANLRLEIQFKNILSNLGKLEKFYIKRLEKIGLLKKFLNNEDVEIFLEKLMEKKEITKREKDNIKKWIFKNIKVSKNVEAKYKKYSKSMKFPQI